MHESRGTTKASATAKAAEAAASAEASTAAEAAAEATTTAETTAATESTGTCKPILTHLEVPALPLVAVELLDSIASVVRRLEGDNARALGPAIGSDMHIGANNLAIDRCRRVVSYIVRAGKSNSPAWRKRSFRSCQPTL